MRLNLVAAAALNIPRHALALVVIENFAEQHAIVRVAVPLIVAVVEMRSDLEPGVAHRPKWQRRVVEIDEIRLVTVDEIGGAVVELLAIGLVGRSDPVAPFPAFMNGG